MKTESIKWGILGPGKIARKFAAGLADVNNAQLYSVGSRSIDRAREFAKETDAVKYFGSYEEMLTDKNLDVVYVATPHVFHHEHTLLCLKHKKAVLCEKPFAMNVTQVEEMIATAKREKVFLMEALWTQFLPHFRFVIEVVKSGKYGKVKNLKADFGFNAPFDAEGRLFNKALGGGSLMDIGIYPVFAAMSILGKPETISSSANLCSTGVDEDCSIVFHYKNDVAAELQCSINKHSATTATILFEKAIVHMNTRFHEPTSLKISTENGDETIEFDVSSNGYNFEAAHVQQMLKEGKTESNEMTFEKSKQLITLLDDVREKIALVY